MPKLFVRFLALEGVEGLQKDFHTFIFSQVFLELDVLVFDVLERFDALDFDIAD